MYAVVYAEGVKDDLAALRPFERNRVLDRIDDQLRHQPTKPTRNRKILVGLVPPWEHEPPIWELRIGEYRAFYDVNEVDRRVIVRAIRHKPPQATTEAIL